MAEAENGADPAATPKADAEPQAQAQPNVRILGQYVRDMSFENLVVQKGISGDMSPDIQVRVSLDAKKRPQDDQYEVISKFAITSKNKESDDTLFLLELEYGGVFKVENVPQEQLHPFLLIECPRMLFPFVRRIVSDVTRDGGFPPLNLEVIDFLQLYRQTLAQRQAQKQEEATVT